MSLRVFIGSEPKTEIAAQVLMHSITSRTRVPIEFTVMVGPEWEYPIKGIKVGTGFSLRRWMIPKAMNWNGGAIYLDADQIVFADIKELLDVIEQTAKVVRGITAWTTYQPDKYYKHPAPQTSVMALDCENAKGKWGFEIDKILAHLRGHPDKVTYAKFMHAEWMMPKLRAELPKGYLTFDDESFREFDHPVKLPIEWNHLNKYEHGKTKLLHYTKEDEQCWYKPDHPLAKHWKRALELAIDANMVTQDMLKKALSQWGNKQDWRRMNGLHPWYKRYLKS